MRPSSGALAKFGIDLQGASLNLDQMHAEKAKAVTELTGGIEFLFKKNKVDWLKGYADFDGRQRGHGRRQDRHRQEHHDRHRLVGHSAAGRRGRQEAGVIVDSTGALELPKVPDHMVVIGGGVIGLELG